MLKHDTRYHFPNESFSNKLHSVRKITYNNNLAARNKPEGDQKNSNILIAQPKKNNDLERFRIWILIINL